MNSVNLGALWAENAGNLIQRAPPHFCGSAFHQPNRA